MTSRKKNILLIQILIFITAIVLIYYTYLNKDKGYKSETLSTVTKEKKEDLEETQSQSNTFSDVEYKGVDLRGNRYEIRSEIAEFKTENPELINMELMSAVFYFKDGTILKVRGDYGTYNNKTNDMKFRENIKAEYKDNYLFADNLDFLNTKNSLSIYGNVRTESIQGNITADNLEFDLLKQTLDISMLEKKQVNIKLRN